MKRVIVVFVALLTAGCGGGGGAGSGIPPVEELSPQEGVKAKSGPVGKKKDAKQGANTKPAPFPK